MQGGKQGSGTGRIRRKPCIIFFTVVIAVILLISLLVIFLVVLKEYQQMHKIISLHINTGSESIEDPSNFKNASNYLDDIGGDKLSRQYSYFSVEEKGDNLDKVKSTVLNSYVKKATGYGYADVFLFDEYLRRENPEEENLEEETKDDIIICTSVAYETETYDSTVSKYTDAFKTVCDRELNTDFCDRFKFKKCESGPDNQTFLVAVDAYKEAASMREKYLNKSKDSYGSSVPQTVYIKPPMEPSDYETSRGLLMYFYQYIEECVKPKFNKETGEIDFGADDNCETRFCRKYAPATSDEYKFCQKANTEGEVDI